MRPKYQVTFEFMESAPITIKGEVQAGSAETCAARAVREAKKRAPGLNWTSMVVLLDRFKEEGLKE
jgi:hypothetical protein